ncbi:hypothetical protein Krac_4936 [Ktedonobacter racemifer DSM 44963]|uniref:Uncharacterized protein n=1 Tax=Ktedonobacter racemifer DSM 44963 TaxID=485913 RepID=D6TU31_KTERA|nr:hypothetical protein Krac_4936 [Ktedonobacter racemifer DSM 44963]
MGMEAWADAHASMPIRFILERHRREESCTKKSLQCIDMPIRMLYSKNSYTGVARINACQL